MTIEDYRIQLGWSLAELARRANIDVNTLKRAINGTPVYKRIAGAIASALSQGLRLYHHVQRPGRSADD